MGSISLVKEDVARLLLRASSDGRYLINELGVPFRIHGDSAWTIFNELDSTELEVYLADCRARGINTLIVQATNSVKYVESSHAPGAKGVGDAKPWLLNTSSTTWTGVFANHDAAFSSPNDTYWDWVDYVIRRCRAYRIVLIIDPMYMGFNAGAADGWWQDLHNTSNTQAVCFAFGQYLGARWAQHPNLIIDIGTDMFPTSASEDSARMAKIFDGLLDAGCRQLVSAHYARSSDALDYADYASRIGLNSVYPGAGGSGYAPSHGRGRRAYNRSPAMPCVTVETKYEGEFSFTRRQVREQGWWAYLSCIGGACYGNGTIWVFDTGWATHLSDPARVDHQRMGAFLDARPWWTLVPSGLGSIGTLVTAGGGSAQTLGSVGTGDTNDGTDFVAAAANPAGTLLVAYVPHSHTGSVTIDRTKMSANFTARWFDPTNASYTAIGTDIAHTGTQAFTIPGANSDGANDWVLVLEVP